MSKSPRASLSALINDEVAPKVAAALSELPPEVAPEPAQETSAPLAAPPPAAPIAPRPAAPVAQRQASKTTLRARSKQLSLYLELPVYDQLREIAFVERVKMHQLVVEAIDLLFKKRGQPPIRELMKKANQS